MRATVRRLAISVAALAVVFGGLGVQPQAAAAATTVAQAEADMVAALNKDRASAGIVAARIDTRLMAIARARSVDMATKHYFGHTQPDGRDVFDILSAKGIKWYSAGEIIAWNTWPTFDDSVRVANDGWMNSSVHRSIIMSAAYNYVGVGLAIDSAGKKLWTAVFMKGPDRTGGWVTIDPAPTHTATTATAVRTASLASSPSYAMTLSWKGGDVLLSVLTAGFRNYQVQRSIDGSAYGWITTWTTTPKRAFTFWVGHRHDIRIRACDKAGNCGSWRYITVIG